MPPTAYTTETLTKRVDVRVTPETAERLHDVASREETSIGTIVRRALRRFLLEHEAERREHEEPEP